MDITNVRKVIFDGSYVVSKTSLYAFLVSVAAACNRRAQDLAKEDFSVVYSVYVVVQHVLFCSFATGKLPELIVRT